MEDEENKEPKSPFSCAMGLVFIGKTSNRVKNLRSTWSRSRSENTVERQSLPGSKINCVPTLVPI